MSDKLRSLKLPDDLTARLDRVARRKDRSRAWVARQACEQYLAKEEKHQ